MVQQVNYSQIAGATAATAALGLVSYCIYFDYKRRNDKQFRHRLLKEQKKIAQVDQKQQQQGKEAIQAALRRALTMINAEPVPTDVAAREQYFMEQVGLGEQLAARSPEHYVASAISFYRALKVYPAPHELIMIYQKTQPAVVFDLVMEMIGLDLPTPSASRTTTTEPLLTEILPDDAAQAAASPSASTSGPTPVTVEATPSETGSVPSTGSGSFVHVEGEAEKEEETPVVAAVVVEETTVEESA